MVVVVVAVFAVGVVVMIVIVVGVVSPGIMANGKVEMVGVSLLGEYVCICSFCG